MRRRLLILGAAAVVAALLFFLALPQTLESLLNSTAGTSGAPPSARARALFAQALVLDLHADTLLWGRDLLSRSSRGHTDVPRMLEGNIALQAFTLVTTTPRLMRLDRNEDTSDNIAILALSERWPRDTWESPLARALFLAQRLHEAAARSDGALTEITSRATLDAYLARRKLTPRLAAGMLGTEGAQPLEGDLKNLAPLYAAGVRMMAPTHFTDTAIGSSMHGVLQGGLTGLGRAWVPEMEARHMLIDLAHASHATIRDVLALAHKPVVVSHTGVRATCKNNRNLDDGELRAIGDNGGVIGIAFFKNAVCEISPRAVARAMRHAADVAGVEHVGLGSDFDGAVRTPFDATGVVELVDPLYAEGFSDAEIKLILGENTLRVLREVLE